MDRRDFIRKGSLWVAGATVLTPDLLDRLTWTRKIFPSAPLYQPGSGWLINSIMVDSISNTLVDVYKMDKHGNMTLMFRQRATQEENIISFSTDGGIRLAADETIHVRVNGQEYHSYLTAYRNYARRTGVAIEYNHA